VVSAGLSVGPVQPSNCIQAMRSLARATISHQIWFAVKPCRGRFVRPVSFAQRMRSSQRAWRRWRSSRSASWLPGPVGGALVANAVSQAVALDIGEAELGAGVGPFLADGHAHPRRPGGQGRAGR